MYGCSPLCHSNVLTLDLHLKLFAFLERRRESPKQLGNHLQILQADHLDRRMHVTIGQTDQCAGDSSARPKNGVSIRAARV